MITCWIVFGWLAIAAASGGVALQDASTLEHNSDLTGNLRADAPTAFAAGERRSFRIVWGGDEPRTWNGRIQIRGGRFARFTPLGMLPDSAAISDSPQEIRIRSLLAGQFNGCDLEIEGDAQATLLLQLTAREGSGGDWQREIPLQELWNDKPQQFALDDVGSRLAIARSPGDSLSLTLDRDSLVFAPSENFAVQIEPRGPRMSPSAQGQLKIECRRSGTNEVVWTQQIACEADASGVVGKLESPRLTAPEAEGVYDLQLALVESAGYGLLRHDRPLAQRGMQLVVVAAAPPASREGQAPWEEQFSLDPTRPERWTMRRQFNQIKFPARYPAPLGDGARVVSLGNRNVLGLAPKGWQVYALPIDQPGQPHLVEIEYVASRSIALGISILEEDAAGQIPTTGFDAGVFIPRSVAQTPSAGTNVPQLLTHRFVFWPNSKSPYLALTNHDDFNEAQIGQIRILTGPLRLDRRPAERLKPEFLNASSRSEPSPRLAQESAARRDRLLYIHRPNLGILFGAPSQWDREQGLQLDDWKTIYSAADRLIQFLQAQGYTGLMLTVAADGSAIYPSRVLAANPRLDNGVFFANGQDPVRKDVVELLYRMFDRAGLSLVPAIELSGLLPELERGLEFAADDSILLHTGNGVQAMVRKDPADFRPPYNPLSPGVQQAVTQVVDELANRGGGHASYRGVAILLNGRSILALNDEDWGCDSATLSRFAQDAGWTWPAGTTEQTVRQQILENQREAWLSWRSQQLTRFLNGLGARVQERGQAARMYLMIEEESAKSGIDIATLAFSPTQASVVPRPVRWGMRLDDLKSAEQVHVVPVRNSSWWRSPISASSAAAAEFRGVAAAPTFGQMLFQQASWAEFARLAELGVFPRHRGEILRLQQFVPGGIWAQSSFVTGLADSDPLTLVEGGWSIMQAIPEIASPWYQGYTALPQVRLVDVPSDAGKPIESVVVRQGVVGDALYFYAANLMPWPVDVELSTSAAGDVVWRVLSARDVEFSPTQDRSRFRLRLQEFELVSATATGDVRLSSFRVLTPPQATAQMQFEILKLKSKLSNGSPGVQILPLPNANFETPAGRESIPNWAWTTLDPERGSATGDWTAELDPNRSFEGSYALRLSGSQGSLQLSGSLPLGSRTGRVAVSTAVRSEGAAELQLTLSGLFGGQAVTRTRRLALDSPDAEPGSWRPLAVRFNDLPGELSDVRLTWTASGSGTVWLDALEVRDYWLDDEESKALKQLINLASYKLHEQGDLMGCLRILEGYWPRFVDRYYRDQVESAESPSGQDRDATIR